MGKKPTAAPSLVVRTDSLRAFVALLSVSSPPSPPNIELPLFGADDEDDPEGLALLYFRVLETTKNKKK
jgi:hypothetical protein